MLTERVNSRATARASRCHIDSGADVRCRSNPLTAGDLPQWHADFACRNTKTISQLALFWRIFGDL
jgi:hypothetical protein